MSTTSAAAPCFRLSLSTGAIEVLAPDRSCNVKDYPGSVYSAMRTISNGRKLVEIDQHISRLLTSSKLKFGADFDEANASSLSRNFLPFLSHIYTNSPLVGVDMRYTTILDRCKDNSRQFELLCSANEIAPPPAAVEAEVQFLKRLNPQIKSAEWAIQRQAAEKAKRPSSNEVILADENSNLYEGMSSNFAIIDKDNRLITAPNSVVLMGTIMEVVKIVAAELGLTVVEELPTLQTLASCRGAFITSTSRLLLPIGLIITPDGSEVRFERSSPPPAGEGESADATMHMLQLGVLQKIIERSTDIIIV